MSGKGSREPPWPSAMAAWEAFVRTCVPAGVTLEERGMVRDAFFAGVASGLGVMVPPDGPVDVKHCRRTYAAWAAELRGYARARMFGRHHGDAAS